VLHLIIRPVLAPIIRIIGTSTRCRTRKSCMTLSRRRGQRGRRAPRAGSRRSRTRRPSRPLRSGDRGETVPGQPRKGETHKSLPLKADGVFGRDRFTASRRCSPTWPRWPRTAFTSPVPTPHDDDLHPAYTAAAARPGPAAGPIVGSTEPANSAESPPPPQVTILQCWNFGLAFVR
jgi:hypothetical protein